MPRAASIRVAGLFVALLVIAPLGCKDEPKPAAAPAPAAPAAPPGVDPHGPAGEETAGDPGGCGEGRVGKVSTDLCAGDQFGEAAEVITPSPSGRGQG